MVVKEIAILLTCHNRKEKTIECLTALYSNVIPTGYSFDVFLVDDGSTDGTGEAVKEDYPNVNIILGTGDLYWNRGMHLAWKTATKNKNYDFYLWLNDDVKLLRDSIKIILDDAIKAPDCLLCGVMASEDTGNITYGGRDKNGKILIPNKKEPIICMEVNGNFVLIPKEIYEQVGMLDPIFPHAIGDFDYGFRCVSKGFTCKITSKIVGHCEANPQLPKWCLPEVSFLKRVKVLYSPLGNSHPYYYFLYEKRHFGLLLAIKHFLTIHLRVLIPQLWKQI
ncbi:glycosyltransferase family 2 protein [Algibacter sp. L1A34]|uniref:glycosyltransferase family 2 protein n=1 Tax=Algibacter sp. L1A34 TaxID=2686365 RepID=UPI00131AA639|nr:glycosyltransferase family 2 protein [Algibacter sp. L1A34]